MMAWCCLADSHNPNRSPEQCLQTQSYVIIRLKLVNFTTSSLAQTVNGTGRPGTQRSTGHCVSVSGRRAAQRPTGHCVAGHPGTQRPTGHCLARHPGTQWWTAHCVAGTRVHSIVHKTNYVCSVFALGKYVDIAWSEMKMAQVIDIHSWGEENYNNCFSQYNALWYGQDPIYTNLSLGILLKWLTWLFTRPKLYWVYSYFKWIWR